jgi:hypothetical protein
MIASKSDPARGEFDTFSCLRCQTVITTVPASTDRGPTPRR